MKTQVWLNGKHCLVYLGARSDDMWSAGERAHCHASILTSGCPGNDLLIIV